jgi:hypothetical protein
MLIVPGESWATPVPEPYRPPLITCAARRLFKSGSSTAHQSHGKIGYVMLDVFASSPVQFGEGPECGPGKEAASKAR